MFVEDSEEMKLKEPGSQKSERRNSQQQAKAKQAKLASRNRMWNKQREMIAFNRQGI